MNTIFLMASPDGQGSSFSLIMMGAIILVFWLFMIRPQAKKAKEQKQSRLTHAKQNFGYVGS